LDATCPSPKRQNCHVTTKNLSSNGSSWFIMVYDCLSLCFTNEWAILGPVRPIFRQTHWQLRRQAVKKLCFDRISSGISNTSSTLHGNEGWQFLQSKKQKSH
jgi:hypothetical protein